MSTRLSKWTKQYRYKKGVLEYDSLNGWIYTIKGAKKCTIVRLPFYQKKQAIKILEI